MRSCLTVIVLIVLTGFMYSHYRDFIDSPTPVRIGEYSPSFKKSVLTALENYIDRNPQIERITVEGSILDIHYRHRVSTNQYRLDASIIAEQFSDVKWTMLNNGDVLVRCVYDELVRVEAISDGSRIRLEEL